MLATQFNTKIIHIIIQNINIFHKELFSLSSFDQHQKTLLEGTTIIQTFHNKLNILSQIYIILHE